MRDILAWIVAVEILGLAVLPLLRVFFGDRRDAALLCRPLGLAIVAYTSWLIALWGDFDRFGIIASIAVVGVAAWLVHRRSGTAVPAAIWVAVIAFFGWMFAGIGGVALERFLLLVAIGGLVTWLRQRPTERLAAILFWAATGVFLGIRAALPEILGQEKFMDLAFLNSLTRNLNMPPADPWMSGLTINYYYWGYLLAAAATKLANVSTFVSYNLALATFAGYSFVAAACLGLRLSKGRWVAGIAGAVATVFAGNLVGAFDGWGSFLGRGFNYFQASRVIGLDPATHEYTTISEFPFFTFFQADLHPHLLAFPYFIAAFAVGHRFLVQDPIDTMDPAAAASSGLPRFLRRWWPALLLMLTGGTAIAANLWSLPAIGILIAVVCLLRKTRGRALPEAGDAILGLIGGLLLLLFAYELCFSYERSFSLTGRHPEVHGIARNTVTSDLLEFLGFWGILFALGLAAVWPRGESESDPTKKGRRDLALAAAAALSLLAALSMKAPALAVLLFLGLLAARIGWQALSETHDADEAFAAFVLLLGLAMIAGCEFVHFKDSYGDRMQRMNTIFKFYNQAWPLIAVPVAVFAERRWRQIAPGPRRLGLAALLAASVFAALLYPAVAIVQRLGQHDGPITLDARIALTRRNPQDAAAIAWLERNVHGGSVLLEASGDPYSEYARMSTHTGIPAVMGWANHEGLWREGDPEVGNRAAKVKVFYTTRDPRVAFKIIKEYHVSHVVLGELESRTYANADGVATLPFLEPVFPGMTSIFRVATPAPTPEAKP